MVLNSHVCTYFYPYDSVVAQGTHATHLDRHYGEDGVRSEQKFRLALQRVEGEAALGFGCAGRHL